MSRPSRRPRSRPAASPAERPGRSGGFSVRARRTVAASTKEVYAAWADHRRRMQWFTGVPITLRRAVAPRTLRMTCGDDNTDIDVRIAGQGRGRCLVTVLHTRLASRQIVAERRHCWKEMLAALKHYVERAG